MAQTILVFLFLLPGSAWHREPAGWTVYNQSEITWDISMVLAFLDLIEINRIVDPAASGGRPACNPWSAGYSWHLRQRQSGLDTLRPEPPVSDSGSFLSIEPSYCPVGYMPVRI
jgi:hypothetical protein